MMVVSWPPDPQGRPGPPEAIADLGPGPKIEKLFFNVQDADWWENVFLALGFTLGPLVWPVKACRTGSPVLNLDPRSKLTKRFFWLNWALLRWGTLLYYHPSVHTPLGALPWAPKACRTGSPVLNLDPRSKLSKRFFWLNWALLRWEDTSTVNTAYTMRQKANMRSTNYILTLYRIWCIV